MSVRRLLALAVTTTMVTFLSLLAPASLSAQTPGITGVAAVMFGFNEPARAGDPDAIGLAGISLNEPRGRLCWTISVSGVDGITAVTLHAGADGHVGDALVSLSIPRADGTSTGCVHADPGLIAAITANPSGFYVNVTSTAFPEGAIRGQLG